jgi:hypothetical protein
MAVLSSILGFRIWLLTVPLESRVGVLLRQVGIHKKSRAAVTEAKCCVPNLLDSHCEFSCVYFCTSMVLEILCLFRAKRAAIGVRLR